MTASADLTDARELVFERCLGWCEMCGRAPAVDAHHRQPRGMGGVHGAAAKVANSVPNLLGACRPCHDRVDHDPTPARTRAWLVPHPHIPAKYPAYLNTVNGIGWYLLLADGTYQWIDPDEVNLPWT